MNPFGIVLVILGVLAVFIPVTIGIVAHYFEHEHQKQEKLLHEDPQNQTEVSAP